MTNLRSQPQPDDTNHPSRITVYLDSFDEGPLTVEEMGYCVAVAVFLLSGHWKRK